MVNPCFKTWFSYIFLQWTNWENLKKIYRQVFTVYYLLVCPSLLYRNINKAKHFFPIYRIFSTCNKIVYLLVNRVTRSTWRKYFLNTNYLSSSKWFGFNVSVLIWATFVILVVSIVRLTMWHLLFLELWLVGTWFFAEWRHQRAVTCLENAR